ncbi:MAG: hypothetical protein V1799_01825 [bacterium]
MCTVPIPQRFISVIVALFSLFTAILSAQETVDRKAVQENKDALINQLNNQSAWLFQHRIRPKSMGGGTGSYEGAVLPAKLTSTDDAYYFIAVKDSDHVVSVALSKKGFGVVKTMMYQDGRMADWEYYGLFDDKPAMAKQTIPAMRLVPAIDPSAVQSNKDAVINELNHLAAFAYQFRIRPSSMGGGNGAYTGFSIPTKLRENDNATYSALVQDADHLVFGASSKPGYGTVKVSLDGDGRFVSGSWIFAGAFAGERTAKAAAPVKDSQSNRDAIINDLNNLAANAYQYRIRPQSMGGGQGKYTGYNIPTKMRTNENATYETNVINDDLLQFKATSAQGSGTVEVQIDGNGRFGQWKYGGAFGDQATPSKPAVQKQSPEAELKLIVRAVRNLAASAIRYRTAGSSSGGGEGVYTGFSIPEKRSEDDLARYSAAVSADKIVFKAISKRDAGSVMVTQDESGKFGKWELTEEFSSFAKSTEQYPNDAPLVVANRDAIINDLNNLTANAYQYRIQPKSMGGGEGTYTGYALPVMLQKNSNAAYVVEIVNNDTLRFKATSAFEYGAVQIDVDGNGRMGLWTYWGRFQ